MYSYDRTAAILPLVIDEIRVRKWIQHKRPTKKIKVLILSKGSSDTEFDVSANFDDGSNERFEVKLRFDWKTDHLEISPNITGV